MFLYYKEVVSIPFEYKDVMNELGGNATPSPNGKQTCMLSAAMATWCQVTLYQYTHHSLFQHLEFPVAKIVLPRPMKRRTPFSTAPSWRNQLSTTTTAASTICATSDEQRLILPCQRITVEFPLAPGFLCSHLVCDQQLDPMSENCTAWIY